MFARVRNSAGSVLLQILVATAVMGASFYYLTNYVIEQKKQVGKTANLVNLRLALNSAMDYVIYGVRQKYCFTNDDILLNETPDKCNLQHSGSVERLMMSVGQENFIKQLIVNGQNVGPVDPKNISLKEIHRYIKVSAVSANHPLFHVLQTLRLVKGEDGKQVQVDGIAVDAIRDDSAYLPQAGREVYIKVTVALKAAKEGEPLVVGRTKLFLTSQLAIYPREVGSFALLVANDLRLDKAWNESLPAGDVALHKFSSRSELGKSPGLVFMSPVFVNKNIHLPLDSSGGTSSANSEYSAVTFADRVYLGNGWIMANGATYSPASLGGSENRYWADARTFGGFLKGIENDGGLDKGLDVFKNGPGAASSTLATSIALMKQCIELTQARSSRFNLYQSEVNATQTAILAPNSSKYRLFLTRGNEFIPQWNPLRVKTDSWDDGKVEVNEAVVRTGGAVMSVKLKAGSRFAEVQIPRSGVVKLVAPVGSEAYRQKLENAKNAAQATYDSAVVRLDQLVNELAAVRRELSGVRSQLDAELSKPGVPSGPRAPPPDPAVDYQDPGVVSSLESEIRSLQRTVSSLDGDQIPAQSSEVNAASRALDVAKTDYSGYLNLVENPPVIELSTARVAGRRGTTSPGKVDLNIKFSNVRSFLDADGTLVSPDMEVQVYDGSFYRSSSITFPSNTNLTSYMKFNFNASQTELIGPLNASRTPSSGGLSVGESAIDYGALEAECEAARNAQTSQSFGGAGWSMDFSSSTRVSWNFAGGTAAGKDPGLDTLTLKDLHRSNATFQIRSIVGQCVIESTADFVTGFFTCDNLEIKERTQPLRIIGTFIVGKMRIHPSAIKAGITWSSIYSSQATRELRSAKILQSFSGRDCNKKDAEPIWHPIPSVQEASDRMGCNTISLRAKADPFQWTSVDPDCGVLPGATSSNTSCKRRLIRFFVVEQSRESGI